MKAFRQFRIYPLQSFLIVLALALGVAVVTAVVATLQQTSAVVDDSLWSRQITLQTKKNDYSAFGLEAAPVREVGLVDEEPVILSVADLARAKAAAPSVDNAYVSNWSPFDVTQADESSLSLDVLLVTEDYFGANTVELGQGSLPSESDYADERNVIVLAQGAAQSLGLTGDPVGQTIELTDFEGVNTYTVIGTTVGDEHQDDGMPNSFVPYRAIPWETDGLQELTFAVADKAQLGQARAELQAFAATTWGERVVVRSANDDAFLSQQRLIAIIIAAFASTALAAASLNTMNLMLARVLKRRHDIGIQRSLGATRAGILQNFLAESLVLGALGGLLGIGAGYGLYYVFNSYQLAAYGDEGTVFVQTFPLSAVGIGLAIALATSLLFGFYPAWQASRLRPVEALREI